MSAHHRSTSQNTAFLNTDSESVSQLKTDRDEALRAAREAIRDSTRLTRLLSVLNDEGEQDALLDKALSTLSELFLADVVVLLDPVGTGSFLPLAAIGLPEHLRQTALSEHPDSLTMRVMSTQKTWRIDSSFQNTPLETPFAEVGVNALVGLPVDCCNEKPRGVLLLGRLNASPFGEDEIALLGTMAYRIGRALIEGQRSKQLELLVQSGRQLSRRLDLTQISADTAKLLPHIVRADAAAVVLKSKSGRFSVASTHNDVGISPQKMCDIARTLASHSALANGESVFTSNLQQLLCELDAEYVCDIPAVAFAGIPVCRDGQVHGILIATRSATVPFNTGARQAARLFGEQVASAIENTHLYQAVHSELSERKRLEEAQRRWERHQQQVQKASSLNSMAGAIAHHFNNQLCVVLGNLEIMTEELKCDSALEVPLRDATQAAQKAAKVSKSMLTYIGQTVGVRKSVDIAQICRQSLPLLQTAAPTQVTIQSEIDQSGPIVNGDGVQLQQMLANLITNSWEAIGEDQGTISVTVSTVRATTIPDTYRFPLEWTPDAPDYACITVSDSSQGISIDNIDKLFDPFFSTKSAGRGLGLSVVLGIVKAHGGAVCVTGDRRRGSQFQVFLPVPAVEVEPSERSGANQMPANDRANDRAGNQCGVLIVDDEESIRNFTRRMLTRLGFSVFTAFNGIEALQLFEQHRAKINLVLCDLTMPGMNGWETIDSLRKTGDDIPIILFSGHDRTSVITDKLSEFPNLSSVYFLAKPFTVPELQNLVEKAIGVSAVPSQTPPR